ncbi:MAG: hypothetical protein ACRELF_24835, partial [Gemmataceae bacterium]
MPIHFRCPHCDKLLAIGTRKGGTQIHCPLCAHLVTVPPRTEVDLPTTTVVPPELPQSWWTDAPKSPPTPEPPVPPSSDSESWWIATPPAAVPPPLPQTIPETEAPEPRTQRESEPRTQRSGVSGNSNRLL